MKLLAILICCVIACPQSHAESDRSLEFTGMCDASAIVTLDDDLFAVANDEENVLRFYRLSQPGAPVDSCNLNQLLMGRKKWPEMDIEGVTRLGQRVFWITSHGRKVDGAAAPDRQQLFALDWTQLDGRVVVKRAGGVYTQLIHDLSTDPRYARFGLAAAAQRTPKEQSGLNIEALAATTNGTLLIGFRSPVPEGQALIVPLLNPNDVITGSRAKFGKPMLLDLDGLGLRGMESTSDGYYLLAGAVDDAARHALLFWGGASDKPRLMASFDSSNLSPEGICLHTVGSRTELLLVSDDGSLEINGTRCKDLPESQRRFRLVRRPL